MPSNNKIIPRSTRLGIQRPRPHGSTHLPLRRIHANSQRSHSSIGTGGHGQGNSLLWRDRQRNACQISRQQFNGHYDGGIFGIVGVGSECGVGCPENARGNWTGCRTIANVCIEGAQDVEGGSFAQFSIAGVCLLRSLVTSLSYTMLIRQCSLFDCLTPSQHFTACP